jgi:aromatic ring hydroxylase
MSSADRYAEVLRDLQEQIYFEQDRAEKAEAERDALRARAEAAEAAYDEERRCAERHLREASEEWASDNAALRARVAELAGELAATRFALDERAVAESREVEARIARGDTSGFVELTGDAIRNRARYIDMQPPGDER